MTTDPIAAARALIEPLTGYTPKPWKQGQNNPDRVSKGGEYIANCNPTHQSHPRTENNARLMAASPDLRDMVATLADALEAERAKVAAAYEAAEELCKRRSQDYAQMVANAGRSGPSHPEYVCDSTFHHWSGKSSAYSEMATDIRNLTPSDAQAALDKMLAEARNEAVEKCAAVLIDLGYVCESGETLAEELRALKRPEASHG